MTRSLTRSGYFVACRVGADGFVYASSNHELEGTEGIGRMRKSSCEHDPQLWADFRKMSAADHLTRMIAHWENRKPDEYVQIEEKPYGGEG